MTSSRASTTPALAVGPEGGDWDEQLEPVGVATDRHQAEGPILAQVQGTSWFLASDGRGRRARVGAG